MSATAIAPSFARSRPAGASSAGVAVAEAEADRAWLDAVFGPGPEALGARYQLVRELGRGGMGVVVLARDRTLHRVVALKLLHPALAATAQARARFLREARLQAQLEHPGIVPVHAYGEAALPGAVRVSYFAMPYIAGESLAERMRREGRLPAAEVRRILLALCDALAHAHARGIVHRDLKPENVLLDETGRVLLTDFGVASRPSHDDPRRTEHDAGTPLYMAPEQFAGEHAIDGRTDLYGLGAIAYTLLAGRAPFAGANARALAVARFTSDAPPLAPLAPQADRALVAAVERCLARDPAERWPRAEALVAALGARTALGARLRAGWQAWLRARAVANDAV